jgi:hypothetical protein
MKWLERSVLLMLLAGLLMAPQTAQINSYVNGQILTADQLNAEFGNLYSTINGLDEDNLLPTTSIPPAYITATINGQGLDRSGGGVLSVNGIISDGTAGTPGLRFNSDTNTGLYRIGADNVGFSLGGTLRWDIDTTDIVSTLPLRGPSGSASSPTFSFSGDSNTGVYLSGTDQVGLSAGGTVRLSVDPTDVTSTLPYIGPVGSASAPTYSFSGDTDTGFYVTAGALRTAVDGVEYLRVNSGGILLPTSGEQFVGQVGSATTPSFSFSGDGNTGMYASTTDTIAFTAGGAAKLTVDTDSINSSSTVGLVLGDTGAAGGNVPHRCAVASSSGAFATVSVACAAGEMATGGGCRGLTTTIDSSRPDPTTGTPTGWECHQTGSVTMTAYAICCDY